MKTVLKFTGALLALVVCIAIAVSELGCALLFSASKFLTQEKVVELLDRVEVTELLDNMSMGQDADSGTALEMIVADFAVDGFDEQTTKTILSTPAMREIVNEVALHAVFGAIYADADMFVTAEELALLITERTAAILEQSELPATDGDQIVLGVFLTKSLGNIVKNITLENSADEKSAKTLEYVRLALNRQTRFTMISFILILALVVMLFRWSVIFGLRESAVATFLAGIAMVLSRFAIGGFVGGTLKLGDIDFSGLSSGALWTLVPELGKQVGALLFRYGLITMAAGVAAYLFGLLFSIKAKKKKRNVEVVVKN